MDRLMALWTLLVVNWFCLPTVTPGVVHAADTPVPRIVVNQAGADALKADLKAIIEGSPNSGLKKQWKKVEETLDSFLLGLSNERPLRLDLVLEETGFSLQPYLPATQITGDDGLISNLKGFGFLIKELGTGSGLYELKEQGKKPFFMRAKSNSYVQLAATQDSLPSVVPDIEPAAKESLGERFDLVAELKNSTEQMDGQRALFKRLRSELEAALKAKRDEPKERFELRRLAAIQQFDDLERFFVESETLRIGWTTAAESLTGTGALELTAMAGTDLHAGIQLLGTEPSPFAGVQLHDKPVFSGKINFVLDSLQKRHLDEFLTASEPVSRQEIQKSSELSEGEREASLTFGADLVAAIRRTGAQGFLSGFIDAFESEGGKYTWISGMRVESGADFAKLVEKLPQVRADWVVKLNDSEHSGVAIHALTVPERQKGVFFTLFAGEPVFYVGTSEHAVWLSAGVGALEGLKVAIDQSAVKVEPEAEPTLLSYKIRVSPLLELEQVIAKEVQQKFPAKTKEEIRTVKDRNDAITLMLEGAVGGEDYIEGTLRRSGDAVLGTMQTGGGVLRLIGSLMGNFAKKNL